MITAEDLKTCERFFSPAREAGIKRRSISPFDLRRLLPKAPGMVSGGRMSDRNYAEYYEEVFKIMPQQPEVIVELGVLKGVGLACWSKLFPKSFIIGLDIDLTHYYDNLMHLMMLGAFYHGRPEVYKFDELHPDVREHYRLILQERKIDLFIDDALHDDRSIAHNLKCVWPHMSDHSIYIIEDNETVHRWCQARLPNCSFIIREAFTAIIKNG